MPKYFILAAVLAMFGFTSQTWADEDDCPKGIIQGEWLAGEIVPNPIPSFCSRMYALRELQRGPQSADHERPDCKRIYTNPPGVRSTGRVAQPAVRPTVVMSAWPVPRTTPASIITFTTERCDLA
jgi:hypothetical protein